MVPNVSRDLPFSRNQPLKSADEQYTGILKNKIKTLQNLDEIKKTRNLDLVI
jgi:hypothetical protein